MKTPMLEKYVDDAAGIWMIFGTRPDGTVDVVDQTRDIFAGLPPEVATQVVALHDQFIEELYKLLCKKG